MNKHWFSVRQLDRQLAEWQAINQKYGRPRSGWIKTLRTVLCMTAEQLARRLGITRASITQLENAEIEDAVTLRTLRKVAHAMECDVVYALVPKNKQTLESIIKKRSEQIAQNRIARVAHTMSLEAQAVNQDTLEQQKNELANSLIEHLSKKIWQDDQVPGKNDLARKIAEYLRKKK